DVDEFPAAQPFRLHAQDLRQHPVLDVVVPAGNERGRRSVGEVDPHGQNSFARACASAERKPRTVCAVSRAMASASEEWKPSLTACFAAATASAGRSAIA